jgi:hypothetical protein
MKKIGLFLLLLSFSKIVCAQQINLSEDAQISVLTIGQGQSLNDAFGHSAFRIKDNINRLDVVFNYGVYDFQAPYFLLKFAQGKLNYLIGLNNYEDFYRSYTIQNRTIKEQVLNLDLPQKQVLLDYLSNNLKPENRRYLYEFFFDNCATKIRDVLETATKNDITFNTPVFEAKTFRALIYENVDRNSWGSFGIDLALGSVIDKTASAYEHMFLPEYIFRFFAEATLVSENNPLVKHTQVLYKKHETAKSNKFFTSPIFILGLLAMLIIFITYQDFKNNTASRWLDVSLFSTTGVLGLIILLLWFATDHKGTHQNYNLLWACALNLFVIPQLLKKEKRFWFIKYLKFLTILLCLLTLHWLIGIQVFTIGLIPFLIALFIRYIYLIRFYNLGN